MRLLGVGWARGLGSGLIVAEDDDEALSQPHVGHGRCKRRCNMPLAKWLTVYGRCNDASQLKIKVRAYEGASLSGLRVGHNGHSLAKLPSTLANPHYDG